MISWLIDWLIDWLKKYSQIIKLDHVSKVGKNQQYFYQVIQAVTFWSLIVGGHQKPLKGTRCHHPKKVTSRIARKGSLTTMVLL